MVWSGLFAELVDTRSSDRQLAQYAAVAAGLRRCLDDWIPADRMARMHTIATRLGLTIKADCVFEQFPSGARLVGSEYAPTTRASASPYREGATAPIGSRVHVVVSSREEWAAEGLIEAWYSVAVDCRVLRKPLIDHQRMGRALGYPSCCVDFFLRHNDWARQNTIAEAARHTSAFHWETNCLTKLTPWMLSFHMPCAFDCPETVRYAREVLHAVRLWDSVFAEEIVAFMRRPCFALSERFACAFRAGRALNGNHYYYEGIDDLCAGAPSRTADDELRLAALAAGDSCRIDGPSVYLWRNGSPTATLEARADMDVVEVPLFLPFV